MNKLHQSELLIYTKPLVFAEEFLISDVSLICTSFYMGDGEFDGEVELN